MIKQCSLSAGRSGACFVCDACKRTIETPEGAAIFLIPQEGGTTEIVHAHKGGCHDIIESGLRLQNPEKSIGWDELSFHASCLLNNSNITESDMKNTDVSRL